MVQRTQVGGRWPILTVEQVRTSCWTGDSPGDIAVAVEGRSIWRPTDILRARPLSRHEIAMPTCGSDVSLYRTHRCIASTSLKFHYSNFGSLVVWAERCRLLYGTSDRAASRTQDESRSGWCHSEGCLSLDIGSGLHGDRPY